MLDDCRYVRLAFDPCEFPSKDEIKYQMKRTFTYHPVPWRSLVIQDDLIDDEDVMNDLGIEIALHAEQQDSGWSKIFETTLSKKSKRDLSTKGLM